MALASVATIEAGVSGIFTALKDSQQKVRNARAATQALAEAFSVLNDAYKEDVELTITDLTDADAATLLGAGGEVGLALGRAAVAGDIFKVTGTGDTTDNALQTAKGSAPAAGDKFEAATASTLNYLGLDFDFSAEEDVDYQSIGV